MGVGTQLLLAVPACWQVLGRRQRLFSKLSCCCCSKEHELLPWMTLYCFFFSFPLLLAKHIRFKCPYPQHGSPPVAYQGLLNLDCSPGSFSLLGACPPMHSSLYTQSWSKHKNRQRCYAHIQRDSFLLSCGSFL